MSARQMRVCIIYDCLYPHTVGGAERWYANLAERLVAEGHDVTYVTLRQWDRGECPRIDPRVRVVSAGPRMSLYTADASGRRRVLPPLVFGLGVFAHLLRAGRRYDVVHTCSFPYFSLLASASLRPLFRFRLVVDWFEVWSEEYWRFYLGPRGGRIGALVQRLCARLPQRAFCFSELHAARLRAEGLCGPATVLRGLYGGDTAAREVSPPGHSVPGGHSPNVAERDQEGPAVRLRMVSNHSKADSASEPPLVLFAGRLIPEKRAPLAVEAIGRACARIDGLRGEILGEGPERAAVEREITRLGLADVISAAGFLAAEDVDDRMRKAMCLLLPSRREGYGLVVVEAARWGTPAIVVAGEDNAASELIDEGVNGFVVECADADAIADAIVRAHAGGAELRDSTAAWFERNAERLSLDHSLRLVLDAYADSGTNPGS